MNHPTVLKRYRIRADTALKIGEPNSTISSLNYFYARAARFLVSSVTKSTGKMSLSRSFAINTAIAEKLFFHTFSFYLLVRIAEVIINKIRLLIKIRILEMYPYDAKI